uniref:Uncharacterized protein n=1 Tax=Panagrolaimus davidi TaxID=227884 RepID=A0A914PIB5_9BILA
MDSSSILSFPVSEVDLRNDIIKKLNEIIDYFEQENIQTIPSNNEMIKFAVNQISNVDIEICSKALHALMEITYKGKNYIQVVIDAGGIEPLRGCLKSENQMLVCFATYTLHKVTNGTVEHKEAVVNARIIPILIQLLTSSDDHISSQAMATISNLLVCESGKFVEVVVEAGAIENIVKLLESENSFIIFKAVVSLIFSKYTEEIIRAGAIPALFEILELSEDDDTCAVTEQLLATLAEVDDSIVIDSLDILLSENWMICKHAARILSLIAQDSPNNINLMIKNGVIQKIVQLFQSSDVNRQKAGGFLVIWIADNEEHIQPIIDAGIIPCLVRLLENGEQQNTVHLFHKTDIFDFSKSDICDIAASDICMIALGNSEQKELVIQSGCIPLLIKLLKSTNQDVRHSAINAILGISECSTIEQKQVLIDDGILPFVVELLLDPKLCQLSTEVLANIAKKDIAQVQAIIDANAIPSLIKVLDSPDPDSRESAALVFYFMTCAMDETYNYVVTKTKALPYLVKILEMNDINDYTIVLPMLVNITFGSDEDVEDVVNANTIPSIVKFLGTSETLLKKFFQ